MKKSPHSISNSERKYINLSTTVSHHYYNFLFYFFFLYDTKNLFTFRPRLGEFFLYFSAKRRKGAYSKKRSIAKKLYKIQQNRSRQSIDGCRSIFLLDVSPYGKILCFFVRFIFDVCWVFVEEKLQF